jgi:hypothetical protein
MPTRNVTIVGTMTWDETGGGGPTPPLGIWGPTDPRPSYPIYWPGFPNWGGWPTPTPPNPNPPYPDAGLPLFPFHPIVVPPGGAWPSPPDPNAPRPSHPIMLPGMPGWGAWPNVPSHPIMLPGMPGWGQWPNIPTHPIMLPGMPGWPTTPPPQPPSIEHPPEFSPIPGQQPGPFGKYQWYWSPTYGWVMGVPVDEETSPPEGEIPPGAWNKPGPSPLPVPPSKK